jgi:predicted NBD/HSP70 family sugar kinase
VSALNGAGGSNSGVTREHNRRVVLQALLRQGAMSRAELARFTGLSPQAMSNIAADLMETGLLREMGRRRNGRGQPPVAYAIDPAGGFTIGVEIRPAGIVAVAADLSGDVLASVAEDGVASTPAHVASRLPRLAGEVAAAAGGRLAAAIGVGVVAPRSMRRGEEARAPSTELPGWPASGDPAQAIRAMLPELSVVVDGDASAAALAEQLHGAAKPYRRFACLYFGRGLGLGLVLDGRIQRGARGLAGEIGHVPMPDGREGGLERHLSIDAALKALGVDDPAQLPRAAGFPAWLDGAAAHLRYAVAMVEALLDPEAIILAGQSDALIDGLLARAGELSTTPGLLRGAAGPLSAARGAAALPLYDRFAAEFSGRALLNA